MGFRRFFCALFIVATLLAAGCNTESYDNGPTPVCVSAAGVWDLTMVGGTGTGILCPDRSLTWTIHQSGCNVTIESSQEWDPANGATGAISDNHLYVAWSWPQGCHEVYESISVAVEGDTMGGDYSRSVVRLVYGDYCPGGGICGATLNGVRREP
jgi:hypothetical protein